MTTRAFSLALTLVSSIVLLARPTSADIRMGTVRVQVQDEAGDSIKSANIYIFGPQRDRLIQVKGDVPNGEFVLPPGTYRIFAGMTKPIADAVDHYASPEAKIQLHEDEAVSLILLLQRNVGGNVTLTENNLKHMGLDPDLAKTVY